MCAHFSGAESTRNRNRLLTMQGNSKYLRWSPLYTCCCVFVILSSTVIAVPVRPKRMVDETYSFDAVSSNTISNATCFRDGIEVQKSSVKCEIKTGCKLIQKTGECCPEYQCDCKHENQIYQNGEKITSYNPCRRCVCKGGEITCNDVSCYIRDDCKPRYVNGVCCPQYDNCPPIDDVKITPANIDSKTLKNDVMASIATTTVGYSSSTDDQNLMMQIANENPLGIKIKEITKPEEIRITDDKPKPFNPFKSTTTTTTTTTSTTPIVPTTSTIESTSEQLSSESTTVTTTTTTLQSSFTTETPKESKELITEDTNRFLSDDGQEREHNSDDGSLLAESASNAPSTKASTGDGEVEPELSLGNADSNSITEETLTKSVRQTAEQSTTGDIDQSSDSSYFSSTADSVAESSTPTIQASTTENSEIIDLTSASTPKDVVVVRHGGKTESFHIPGTDGLQRVEELEVIQSSTIAGDAPIQSSDPFGINENVEIKSSEEMILMDSSSITSLPETFDDGTISSAVDKKLEKKLNPIESGTDNASNNSNEVSTPDSLIEGSSELAAVSEKAYETVYYSDENSTTASPPSEEPVETIYYGTTEDNSDSSSTTSQNEDAINGSTSFDSGLSTTDQNAVAMPATELASTTKHTYSYEDEEVTPAQNPDPYYPYIPDDVSIHSKDIVEEEEKRRLPPKPVEDAVSSTAGPCDKCEVVSNSGISTTQGLPIDEEKLSHKMDIIESRYAPGEPHLVPEWERNVTTLSLVNEESTTVGITDITTATATATNNIAVANDDIPKVNKSAALTLDKLPSNAVDSDEKYGRKEPTTERSTTKGYANIDDNEDSSDSSSTIALSSLTESYGSTASPKDDAESIKFGSEENSNSFQRFFSAPSFQNYWNFVAKENGWIKESSTQTKVEEKIEKESTIGQPTTKNYASIDEIESPSSSSAQPSLDGTTASPGDDAESVELNSAESQNKPFQQFFAAPSFQNYWRFVAKENGWIKDSSTQTDIEEPKQQQVVRPTAKGNANVASDSSPRPQLDGTTASPKHDVDSFEMNSDESQNKTAHSSIEAPSFQHFFHSMAKENGWLTDASSQTEVDGRAEQKDERPTTKGYGNSDEIESSSSSSAQPTFDGTTAAPSDDAESIEMNSNESQSKSFQRSFDAPSFQNYWRFVAKENGWSF